MTNEEEDKADDGEELDDIANPILQMDQQQDDSGNADDSQSQGFQHESQFQSLPKLPNVMLPPAPASRSNSSTYSHVSPSSIVSAATSAPMQQPTETDRQTDNSGEYQFQNFQSQAGLSAPPLASLSAPPPASKSIVSGEPPAPQSIVPGSAPPPVLAPAPQPPGDWHSTTPGAPPVIAPDTIPLESGPAEGIEASAIKPTMAALGTEAAEAVAPEAIGAGAAEGAAGGPVGMVGGAAVAGIGMAMSAAKSPSGSISQFLPAPGGGGQDYAGQAAMQALMAAINSSGGIASRMGG